MRPWKLLGLAGLAGVAAGGAVLARTERQRRAHSPDEIRARLRERHAALESAPEAALDPAEPAAAPVPPAELTAGRRHRLARLLRGR